MWPNLSFTSAKCILLLSFLTLLITPSCEEACDEVCTQSTFVSEFEDLIGFLDPNQTVDEVADLFVYEEYLPEVISMLNATSIDVGLYEMDGMLEDGTTEVFTFRTTFTSSPFLFVTDDTPGEIRSKYKAYRNAECEEIDRVRTANCLQLPDESSIWESLGHSKCKKGVGTCLEIMRIVARFHYYEDDECTIPIRTEDIKAFGC